MPSPVISVTPSRTSGKLPLGVTFDATGTTTDLTNSFRDALYFWNFGDAVSGSWDVGANTSQSKNFATGAVAGHTYREAGTYTWTLVVFDGALSSTTTGTITVSDWANDSNTVCVGNVLPVAGVNGVPSNATCVQSNDYDAVISTYIGTNKRILFNNADTFASSTAAIITTTGPAMIGGYGSGPGYSVTSTNISGVTRFSTGATDIRLVGQVVIGSGASDTGAAITAEATSVSKITILDNFISNIGKGIICTGSNFMTDSVIEGNVITDIHAVSGGVGIYGKFVTSAILGNTVGPFATTAEHNVRIQPGQKVSVCNNQILTPGDGGKSCLTIRAGEHATGGSPDPTNDAQYVYFSDNKIEYLRGGVVGAQPLEIAPASNSQNNWISDVIGERNLINCNAITATSSFAAIVSAVRVTLRNNIMDMSSSPSGMTGVSVYYSNTAGSPVPDDVRILNNTIYGGSAAGAFLGIDIQTDPTGTVVVNNIGYSPSSASRTMVSGTGTSPGAISNNSTNAQILISPQFVGPLTSPIGFTVSAASYAADGGTASFPAQFADCYVARDKSGDNRIGALVQTGQAQRKNVAA